MRRTTRTHRIYCYRCRATVLGHTAFVAVFNPDSGWRRAFGLCHRCYLKMYRQVLATRGER